MVIEIFGSQYPITTDETPEYVKELEAELDGAVRNLMNNSSASFPEAMVILCLAYLDGYKKAEQGADHLREQVAEYLEEASQARLELARAKAEIEKLNRDHQLTIE